MTREQYLHQGGWLTSPVPHHQQPWVVKAMESFHNKQTKWRQRLCSVCHEVWPARACLQVDLQNYICTRCKRDKHDTKLFSVGNDMHPGEVPPCLKGMSQVEEMLIARVCPIMSVYRKHGGQRGYKGHVLNLPQDVQGFLNCLPPDICQLPVMVIRRTGEHNTHVDLRVRRQKVLSALQWLQANDSAAISHLPQDGIPSEFLTVEDEQVLACPQDDESTDASNSSHSFLPMPERTTTEEIAIRAAVEGRDPLEWPTISDQPINEYQTPGLATQAFPTLFPHGTGDPTCHGRLYAVSLSECFKHLERYGELVDGIYSWRFASHPRFPYWALNMKFRHQLLSQASVFLHQNQNDANLTSEDLRNMVGTMSSEHLMQRLQRYAAKVQGSNPYWFQRYTELRSLIEHKGPPTFFWTVSSADNHWPELHNLMPHPPNSE